MTVYMEVVQEGNEGSWSSTVTSGEVQVQVMGEAGDLEKVQGCTGQTGCKCREETRSAREASVESEMLIFFCLDLLMSQYSVASFFSLTMILVVKTQIA